MSSTQEDVRTAIAITKRLAACAFSEDRLEILAEALCAERERGSKLAKETRDTQPAGPFNATKACWRVRLYWCDGQNSWETGGDLTGFAPGATWRDAVANCIELRKVEGCRLTHVEARLLIDESGNPPL